MTLPLDVLQKPNFDQSSSMFEEAVYELKRMFTKLVKITQKKDYYGLQGHRKRVCDFLLVINNN